MSVAIAEAPYRPEIELPGTVDEAHLFAQAYSGVRPPKGHPLNFDTLGVHEGLAPWGHLKTSEEVAKIANNDEPSTALWERLSVPAIPLNFINVSHDEEHRHLRRQADNYFNRVFNESGVTTNITPMLFRRSDGVWVVKPVITRDLNRSNDELITDIVELLNLGSKRSESENMQLDMKSDVLYLFTGKP